MSTQAGCHPEPALLVLSARVEQDQRGGAVHAGGHAPWHVVRTAHDSEEFEQIAVHGSLWVLRTQPVPVITLSSRDHGQRASGAFEFRRGLQEACERHGIVLEAYSPLGTGRHIGDRTVAGIAVRLGRTPAQVLIRWSIQRGLVVLPKSTHRERIEQNAQVFDFELSEQDLAVLDGLDRTGGTDRAREQRWW